MCMEWNLCKDLLPSDSRSVIVTVGGEIDVCRYLGGWTSRINGEVIAWMDFPEPYREKE